MHYWKSLHEGQNHTYLTVIINLVANPVNSHYWRKDREVFTTNGTYPWSFVTQIFHSGQPNHKAFEVLTLFQFIRHFRACGSYQDFLDRGLLLTRKLPNQGLTLRTLYDLVDRYGISVSQMTTDMPYVGAAGMLLHINGVRNRKI
jgi:hypothetical protein